MVEYTNCKEFQNQYGSLGFMDWGVITSIVVNDNTVTMYKNDIKHTEIGFEYYNGNYVRHGKYNDWPLGYLLFEIYYKHGKKHNEIGPAYRQFNSVQCVEERYYKDGKRHNENGPAIRGWSINGSVTWEEYYINGLSHREGAPAKCKWLSTGQIIEEIWRINGRAHREGAPALRCWHSDGQLTSEQWYINGRHHREDGPAWLNWSWWNHHLEEKSWWINGEEVPPFTVRNDDIPEEDDVLELPDRWEDAGPEWD